MERLGGLAEQPARCQLRYQALHLRGAEKEIDFGNSRFELALVTLYHASDRDNGLASSITLVAGSLDHRVDRFLLGGVDEATGIDDDDLGVREVGRILGRVIRQLRQIALGVDRVLVAAER